MYLLDQHKESIADLCRKHKVQRLSVFGSVLSEHFSEQSDIDFLVQFDTIELSEYANNYYEFKFSLQQLLQRPVDVIEDQAVRNPFLRQSIQSRQQLLYAA